MGVNYEVGLLGSPAHRVTWLVPPPDILPHLHYYRLFDGTDNLFWSQFPPRRNALLRIVTALLQSTFYNRYLLCGGLI